MAANVTYEVVGASASDQVLGGTGSAGNILERLIVTVSTSGANGTVSIKDGSGSAIPIVAASTPIGVYSINIGAKSVSGAWKVTTGSAATVVAVGDFV
jgi:hypothetical protein